MPTALKTNQGDQMIPSEKTLIDYEEALAQLTEEDWQRATVYAMNTLLLAKEIYTAEEFRFQFRQSPQKELRQKQG